MASMTKITVGIPAYRTKFLTEAISSVLTQTFSDFDLLVSDDSPDGSAAELVSRIRDPRIRIIEGPRQGLVANSAHIWRHASAPLLKFVYDDDKLYPSALEELHRLIEKDERHVLAFSHRDVIDQYGRIIMRPQTYKSDRWLWFEGQALAEHTMTNMANPAGEPTAMLIRKSAFPDASCLQKFAGRRIEHLIDVCLLMNLATRGRAVASPERLCAFRQHAAQVSSNSSAPRYAAGLFEWEIFLRGSVQSGLVAPGTARMGVPKLDHLYQHLGRGFEEIDRFRARLPALAERLTKGETNVLDDAFIETLREAEQIMERRARSPKLPATPRPYASSGEERCRFVLDVVTREMARGYAWLPDEPDKALRVQAVLDARVIGEGRADLPRRDLQWMGSGCYGFEFTFDGVVQGSQPPQFRVILNEEAFDPGDHRYAPFGT